MSVRLFQAYVMVDWSAATKPTTGPDSIWVGVLKRNVRFQMAFEAHNPATRTEAEKLLNAVLDDLGRKRERTLVGFDFPLAFPRGTAAALKLEGEPWRAVMDFVAREVKDKPDKGERVVQLPPAFAPPNGVVVATPAALDLVAYLLALDRTYPVLPASAAR